MDGTMRYTFGAIDALAGDIGARVAAVETRLGDLQSKINNLTAIWEGAANEGFRQTKQQWETAAADLNQVLKKIQIAVNQTNADAQQTENINKGRW
jgi:early secretory antigenic target protein ESAT-6